MASILGASNGIAPYSLAFSRRSFSSTKKNSACGSTKCLINQGQATRSTLMSFRVIHFISTSRTPRVREFDGKAVFVVLRWVCRNKARKTLACGVDHEQVTIGAVIPTQPNIG